MRTRRLCFPRNISSRSGTGTGTGIAVANTNGNGNSGSQSSSQYQPVTSQYQPINVNISIRIASPGNDGPVVQTNLALAMPVVVQTASNHPAPLPVQWLPAAGPASVQAPVASVEVGMAPAEHGGVALRGTLGSGAGQRISGGAPDIGDRRRRRDGDSLASPARARRGRGDTTSGTTGSAPVAVSAAQIATLAPPAPAVAAGPTRQGAGAAADHAGAPDPAPGRRRQPQSATRASVRWAPAARTARCCSSSSFSVPFLLAFADAARRVAEEWKAEAADSGRRREKPG